MNFEFSDEQEALRHHLRRYLADMGGVSRARAVHDNDAGYDRPLWKGLGQMGLLGAAIPEAYGGSGAGPLELCIVADELGRALAPVPFISSIVMAADLLMRSTSETQKARYLRPLAQGDLVLAVARDWQGHLTVAEAGSRLSGMVGVIADLAIADLVLVPYQGVAGPGIGLVDLRSQGVLVRPLEAMDRAHGWGALELLSCVYEPLAVDDAGQALTAMVERAAVLLAFEQVGGADCALETARDYVLERYAFGRPIGSFQAIKHMLADMYVEATLARSNAYFGAWALACGPDRLSEAAAAARISATKAYELCSANNIQAHGGIGFTMEMDCYLHYRRSRALATMLGPIHQWQDRLISALESRQEASGGL